MLCDAVLMEAYTRLFFKRVYTWLFMFNYLHLWRCLPFGEITDWNILTLKLTCSLLTRHVIGKSVGRTEVSEPSHTDRKVFFV
jgi:hypothetical protein